MSAINLPNILFPILDIIDYKNDKETFVVKFTQLCLEKTFLASLQSLPQERQDTLKANTSPKTPEEIMQIMQDNIDKATVFELLQKTTDQVFSEYIQTIRPLLSEEKKQKLDTYLTSLNK